MSEICRNCPTCSEIIYYTSERKRESSERKNIVCKKCGIKRQNDKSRNVINCRDCPTCNLVIKYDNLASFKIATKTNSECKSCCNSGDRNSMYGKCGDLNPFHGKRHSEETKNKISTTKIGVSNHTIESKKKISDWQQDNAPMRGKSVYSVWIEKYGVEIADQKMDDLKIKQSINSSGINNPMYGKPSPNGSGNGYSGWYNYKFFRSLRELMFLIYAKRFKLNLESLEQKHRAIPYVDCIGNTRNYFSDFLVNGKYFVEIKPVRLWTTPNNSLKFEAAKNYCNTNNLKFKLIDPVINSKLIGNMYDNGEIKFLPKYEEKFNKYRYH